MLLTPDSVILSGDGVENILTKKLIKIVKIVKIVKIKHVY